MCGLHTSTPCADVFVLVTKDPSYDVCVGSHPHVQRVPNVLGPSSDLRLQKYLPVSSVREFSGLVVSASLEFAASLSLALTQPTPLRNWLESCLAAARPRGVCSGLSQQITTKLVYMSLPQLIL